MITDIEFYVACLVSCARLAKPLWANAEVSACRMRSLDVSDADIHIISFVDESTEKFRLTYYTSDQLYDEMHRNVYQ